MRAAGTIRPIDGSGGGGGTVMSVNGVSPDMGGNVPLGATDIPYSPTFATAATTGNPSTSVGAQLLWGETRIGTTSFVWGAPTLEEAAPVSAGVHTIDRPMLMMAPLGGAPIVLAANDTMIAANPGSIDALGELKVIVVGNAPTALLGGEVQAAGIGLLNASVDPAARDLQVESLSGRLVNLEVGLLGSGGADIDDVAGVTTGRMLIAPPAPGSRGVHVTGTVGSFLVSNSIAQAPGTVPYTAIEIDSTATVVDAFNISLTALSSMVAGDALVRIDPSATVPGGAPLPTDEVGLRFAIDLISGPGSLFEATGLGADSIEVSSFGHLSGPRSNWIGDARLDTAGAPEDAKLDHVGQSGVALVVPFDNAQNGGAGPTFRELTAAASQVRHTLLLGTVETVSVNAGGTYTGGDGDYPATQASTSGVGTGATFTVSLTGGTITAVVSRDKLGSGYANADTITLAVAGPAETVAAVLDVDLVAWAIRTNGPVDGLTGPVSWLVDFERGAGGNGSTVVGYLARRKGGVGPFVEVPASRSIPTLLIQTPQRVAVEVKGIDDIGFGDEWRIEWANTFAASSTETLFTIIEIDIVGQP